MTREQPFDLYSFVSNLAENTWIEEIQIFGSRRYLSNVSYGSDIDLLIVPNKATSLADLRKAVNDPYVDAFLLTNNHAISAGNQSQISIESNSGTSRFDSVTIWTRSGGWQTDEDYRILNIFPDKTPSMTDFNAGATPVLILCALHSEFEKVRERLPEGTMKTHWRMPPYFRAYVRTSTGRQRLVVVVQTGVASVNAAIAVTRILAYFEHPEIAILVGITAGIAKDGTSLGSVLVPTATVDVESGKVTPKGKEPAGLTLPMSPNHQLAIASWKGTKNWESRWETRSSGISTTPKIIADCTIACTSSVIGYAEFAKSFLTLNRKILGVEMEASGVAAACLEHCPLVLIKAVSDWADEQKDDSWHARCMEMAADLAISLIEDETI